MLKTKQDKRICERYGARDSNGFVHCNECPLRKGEGGYDFRCKANSHYDRKEREWVLDCCTYELEVEV